MIIYKEIIVPGLMYIYKSILILIKYLSYKYITKNKKIFKVQYQSISNVLKLFRNQNNYI